MTLAEINTRIELLEEMLASGVSETNNDGQVIKFRSHDEIEKTLTRLYRLKRKKLGVKSPHSWAYPTFGEAE